MCCYCVLYSCPFALHRRFYSHTHMQSFHEERSCEISSSQNVCLRLQTQISTCPLVLCGDGFSFAAAKRKTVLSTKVSFRSDKTVLRFCDSKFAAGFAAAKRDSLRQSFRFVLFAAVGIGRCKIDRHFARTNHCGIRIRDAFVLYKYWKSTWTKPTYGNIWTGYFCLFACCCFCLFVFVVGFLVVCLLCVLFSFSRFCKYFVSERQDEREARFYLWPFVEHLISGWAISASQWQVHGAIFSAMQLWINDCSTAFYWFYVFLLLLLLLLGRVGGGHQSKRVSVFKDLQALCLL